MLTQVKFCYKMAAPARLQLPVDGLPSLGFYPGADWSVDDG